jgi:hypothetical protein
LVVLLKRIKFGNITARTQDTQSKKTRMTENEISNIVIGLAIDVHRGLGPGF